MRHPSMILFTRGSVLLAAVFAAFAVCTAAGYAQTSEACDLRRSLVGLNDYRSHATEQERWSLDDIKQNHYDPAVQRMGEGEYSRRVLADLNFILNWWPNHIPALEAVIRYELGGGRSHDLPTTACYFARARQFAPNDIGVMILEANYRFKKGDIEQAIAGYLSVLEIEPNSSDVHYNLGLLYLHQSQFDKARQHAWAAYAAGYPLPGLRRRLERVGEWRDPDEGAPGG